MFKLFSIHKAICVFCMLLYASSTYCKEYLLKAEVDARTEYNSNIFLTDLPHEAVKGLIITPSLSGVAREKNWQGELKARIKSHKYSDDNLNSNDQFFNLTGQYTAERNIFSLNINHDFASNLNSTSNDFGIVGRRVNQKRQSISPQYTRLLTERSVLMFAYTYTDVEYLEADNTGFVPYVSETGSGTLVYNLTERDKLTLSLFAVDYKSRDDLVTYQLFMSRFGVDHKFSETLSTDFLIGVSRRNSTNLSTQTFDFFGNVISQTQEIDFSDRGLVLDAGVTQLLRSGKIEARISRDNTTNSFGGLDQFDKFKLFYEEELSALWRYDVSTRYEDISAISSGARTTDRTTLFFESRLFYSISKNWNGVASYRYVQRKFKSSVSNSRAPHSNRIYVGLTYNFPSLSTF